MILDFNEEEINIKEHPFPTEELDLIRKLNSEGKIFREDITILSNLLSKYLDLRAYIFHKF